MKLQKKTDANLNRLFIFFGAIISCYVALVNKFPVVYQDTGTYISSGFSGEVPADRPLFYGLFLRHISLASSLWYVVYAQALILSFLVFKTVGIYFTGAIKRIVFILLISIISIFTGYSFYVSFLVPDIFTAAFYLGVYNLLFNNELKRFEYYFILLIVVFAMCAQFSVMVIFILLLLFVLIATIRKIWRETFFIGIKNLIAFISIFFVSIALTWVSKLSSSEQTKASNTSYVFAMNHLNETHILKEYLDEQCEKKNYKICLYKDSLPWDFLWDSKSPLYTLGGWSANSKEYQAIIWDICLTPKYVVILVQRAFENTLMQCLVFDTQASAPMLAGSPVFSQISWHFQNQLYYYIGSEQSGERLDKYFYNGIQFILVVFSFVLLLTFWSIRMFNQMLPKLNLTICMLMVFYVLNAFISSNLSTVIPRFQGRIAWMIPFFALLFLIKILHLKGFFKKIENFVQEDRSK